MSKLKFFLLFFYLLGINSVSLNSQNEEDFHSLQKGKAYILSNFQYSLSNHNQSCFSASYLGNNNYLVYIQKEDCINLSTTKLVTPYTADMKMSAYDKKRLSESDTFSFVHVFVFETIPFFYKNAISLPLKNAYKVYVSDRKEIDSILAIPNVKFVELPYEKSVSEINGAMANQRIGLLHNSPIPFNGNGMNILLDDDGPIGNHIDYKNRINQDKVRPTSIINDHADHLAGILIGAGNLNPLYRGIAEQATIRLYTYTSDISQVDGLFDILDAYHNHQTYITNTSQGNGCNAGYNAFAQILDQQVVDLPRLLHVFSAGNNGNVSCGYYVGTGFGTITGGSKLSKNTISVGNTIKNDVLNYNSSQGPATDGRIKPEVVATGVNVFSTSNYPAENEYDGMSGTSQASAVVAGTVALLYEAYQSFFDTLPYSDIIKNIVLNTADDLGNAGPDFKFGFGKVNAWHAYNAIKQERFIVDSLAPLAVKQHTITVPAQVKQLKVMLYWHDLPASLGSSINLVNDLNVSISDPSLVSYLPWVLNSFPAADSLNKLAQRGVDSINNVEQITIDLPQAGNYIINVESHFQISGLQRYTISYDFVYDSLQITTPNGGEKYKPSQTVRVYWNHFSDNSTDYTLSYSQDQLNWNVISSTISSTQKWYDWNIPASLRGNYWLKIQQGTQIDVSDSAFTILAVPDNLKLDTVCENKLVLTWDSVPSTSYYVIYKMGNLYMDSIGVSPEPFFIFTTENITDSAWYAVKAVAGTLSSERSIAILKIPEEKNCTISTKEWENANFNVFPNPTQDFVTIQSVQIIKNIQLFDLQGRMIWQQSANANNLQINMSAWANNVYLLKITTENDFHIVRKIIIYK